VLDPSHDGSLAYRICYVGGLWGFRALKVWIRPWEPSQSGGSKLDKLRTRLTAARTPGISAGPAKCSFVWRQENLGKLA